MFRTEMLINYSLNHNCKKINKEENAISLIDQTNKIIDAIKIDDISAVIDLIESKADLNLRDDRKHSPLLAAVKYERISIVKLLLVEKAKIDKYVLPVALGKNNTSIIQLLLKYKADVNKTYHQAITCLHLAAFSCTRKINEILIQHHAKIDAYDNNDETPLIYAIKSQKTDVVDLFLEHKADCNFFTMQGKTPLHFSVNYGHKQITRSLLKHGADPNISDSYTGFTSLHLSLFSKHYHLVPLLLHHGANTEVKDQQGFTPLYWAVEHFATFKKLSEYKCSLKLNN